MNFNTSGIENRVSNEIDETTTVEDNIQDTNVGRLVSKWSLRYKEASLFFEINGHINVRKTDDAGLSQWLYQQKVLCRKGKLSATRVDLLNAIQISWLSSENRRDGNAVKNGIRWISQYENAKSFFEKHGHLRVPSSDSILCRWIYKQRYKYWKGKLPVNPKSQLEEIGMTWDDSILSNSASGEHPEIVFKTSRTSRWDLQYEAAQVFFNENSHLSVPHQQLGLYNWLYRQKRLYQQKALSEVKIGLLEQIGIVWELSRHVTNISKNTTGETAIPADPGKDRNDIRWDDNFAVAEQYFQNRGDLNVPYRSDLALYRWVARQRANYQKGKLSDVRKELLDTIGMRWELADKILDDRLKDGSGNDDWAIFRWENQFRKAQDYYNENGHLVVPYEQDVVLYNWVYRQKRRYRLNSLSKVQIEKLEGIGMSWEISRTNAYELIASETGTDYSPRTFHNTHQEAIWESQFIIAEQYFQKNGNLDVSYRERKLYNWVYQQRANFDKGNLPANKIEKLNQLKINWKIAPRGTYTVRHTNEEQWLLQYNKVKSICANIGGLEMRKIKDIGLRSWVFHQKISYEKGRMPPSRIQLLEELGISWTKVHEQIWQEGYDAARDYFERHGHLLVPKSEKRLFSWLAYQREKQNSGKLAEDLMLKLEEIGIGWENVSHSTKLWDSSFEQAKAYYERNGHLKIDRKKNPRLYTWLSGQKTRYQQGILSPEKMERLEEIGMQWPGKGEQADEKKSPEDVTWREYYGKAKKRLTKLGHLDGDLEDQGLYNWLQKQKGLLLKGRQTREHILLLRKLGTSLFSVQETNWMLTYEIIRSSFTKNGHLFAIKNTRLCSWLYYQRKLYQQGLLSTDRKALLDSIKFDFSGLRRDSSGWDAQYKLAKTFFQKNGHLRIPLRNGSLNKWVARQRYELSRGNLSPIRQKLLKKISFFKPYDQDAWTKQYNKAKTFFRKQGHLWIKHTDLELYQWVNKQRKLGASKRLQKDRERALNAIRMCWRQDLDPRWMGWLKEVEHFMKKYQEVPRSTTNDPLAGWVYKQRIKVQNEKLPKQQILLLKKVLKGSEVKC